MSVFPRLLLSVSLLVPAAAAAQDQAAADSFLASHVRATGERHATPRVVIWNAPGGFPDADVRAFAQDVARGLDAIERIVGRRFDTAHYAEDTIQIFIAGEVGPSHVYGGYAHARHDRPYLFLDAAKVGAGQAPYLHELTHLVAWRYASHSLREGLASYVELEASSMGWGLSSGLFGMTDAAAAEARARELLATPAAVNVAPHVGRGGPAPAAVTATDNPRARGAYYVLSQSFVRFLVDRIGMHRVVRLYETAETDDAYVEVTGVPLETWQAEWKAGLLANAPPAGA
jgi:hypothetical protein